MAPVDLVLLLRSLDTVSDLAMIFDRHFKQVYVNRAAQLLGGLSRAFEPHLVEAFRTRDRVIARQSLDFGEEARSFETIYTPILGDNGNPQYVIAIARDVGVLRPAG